MTVFNLKRAHRMISTKNMDTIHPNMYWDTPVSVPKYCAKQRNRASSIVSRSSKPPVHFSPFPRKKRTLIQTDRRLCRDVKECAGRCLCCFLPACVANDRYDLVKNTINSHHDFHPSALRESESKNLLSYPPMKQIELVYGFIQARGPGKE